MITVEFLGLAEQRAGRRSLQAAAASIGELLQVLQRDVPQFVDGDNDRLRLRASWILNVNGDQFVPSTEQQLREGDVVLLMSVDAGG